MEEAANLDGLLAGLAIAIFLAGMFMLFGGMASLGKEEDGKGKQSKK